MKTKNLVRCPNSGMVVHSTTLMKTKPSQVVKLADKILAHEPNKRSQCEVAGRDKWGRKKASFHSGVLK
jgi:hypothetical protein